jgi:hypothetical protein
MGNFLKNFKMLTLTTIFIANATAFAQESRSWEELFGNRLEKSFYVGKALYYRGEKVQRSMNYALHLDLENPRCIKTPPTPDGSLMWQKFTLTNEGLMFDASFDGNRTIREILPTFQVTIHHESGKEWQFSSEKSTVRFHIDQRTDKLTIEVERHGHKHAQIEMPTRLPIAFLNLR